MGEIVNPVVASAQVSTAIVGSAVPSDDTWHVQEHIVSQHDKLKELLTKLTHDIEAVSCENSTLKDYVLTSNVALSQRFDAFEKKIERSVLTPKPDSAFTFSQAGGIKEFAKAAKSNGP